MILVLLSPLLATRQPVHAATAPGSDVAGEPVADSLDCGCCNNYPTVQTQPSVWGPLDGELTVATAYSVIGTDPSLQLVDVSGRTLEPFLRTPSGSSTDWINWYAPRYGGPPDGPPLYGRLWDRNHIGCVFGLALDKRGNIYTTASSCYPNMGGGGDFPPSALGPAGTIWKIDGATGATSAWVIINENSPDPLYRNPPGPTGTTENAYPALGNIAYDCNHDQFFVTNLENGKIYRIPASGFGITTYDPFGLDPGISSPGFAPLGERLWGIGVYRDRVYFSVWWEHASDWCGGWQGAPLAIIQSHNNEIWSVALSAAGSIIPGSLVKEINIPAYQNYNSVLYGTQYPYSNPVADIEFSPDGRMLLAERSMCDETTAGAHDSRLLEYENPYRIPGVGNWNQTLPAPKYAVYYGGSPIAPSPPQHPSSAGGCDYANCEDVWATMDAIHYPTPYIYGIVNIPATGDGGPEAEHRYGIDLDGDVGSHDKRSLGDVDVPCMVALCGMKWYDADGDGVQDAGEDGLRDWSIYDVNRLFASNTLTDSLGRYSFMPAVTGPHTVGESVVSGWTQTHPLLGEPDGGVYRPTVDSCTVTGLDFGNAVTDSLAGWICLQKFADYDCDGYYFWHNDSYLPGWQITITGPPSQTVTTTSEIQCIRVPVGEYEVCEINQPGWIPSTPPGGCKTITVTHGSRDTVLFGNCPATVGEAHCVEPPSCLVAWWPFDEASGQTAKDVAGCDNGTLVGSPSWSPAQYVNGSLAFWNAGSYVQAATTTQLNFGQGSFSIDAWVHLSGDSVGTRTIVDKRHLYSDPFGASGYHFFIQDGRLGLALEAGYGWLPPPYNTFLATIPLSADWWHLVTVTVCRDPMTPGSNKVRLYVDGAVVGAWNGTDVWDGSVNTPIGTPLRVGQQCPGFDTSVPFGGWIDEVEIFDCCLSADEVTEIFSAFYLGKCRQRCYVPSITTLCDPIGTVDLTVFSTAPTPQNLVWSIATLTGAGCSTPGTTTFSPFTGSLSIPAAGCAPTWTTIPITMQLAPGTAWGSTICYEVTVKNVVTGAIVTCTGKALYDPGLCGEDDPDTSVRTLAPFTEGTGHFRVRNPAASETATVSYRLVPQTAHGDTAGVAMRLNGLPPGTPVLGSISIPEGQAGTISFNVEIDAFQPFRIYEVVLECDTGDGLFHPRAVMPVMTVAAGILTDLPGPVLPTTRDRPRLDVDPNPFAGATVVKLAVARPGAVTIMVHDVTGRLVRALHAGVFEAGSHEVIWDGRDDRGSRVGSGLYFVRVQTPEGTLTAKLLRIR